MRRLVAAEFHKLATTRLWLWLLLGSVALTALYASLAIAFGDTPDNPTPPKAPRPLGEGQGTGGFWLARSRSLCLATFSRVAVGNSSTR